MEQLDIWVIFCGAVRLPQIASNPNFHALNAPFWKIREMIFRHTEKAIGWSEKFDIVFNLRIFL